MKKSHIDSKYFLYLYLLCPTLVMLSIVDTLIFDGLILQYLPDRPEEWSWWLIFFSTPHIISSFMTIANPDDVKPLGRRIIISLTLLILTSYILNILLKNKIDETSYYYINILVFFFYGLLTTNHVLTQQHGIALIIGKQKSTLFSNFYRYMMVSLSFLIFIKIANSTTKLIPSEIILYLEIVTTIALTYLLIKVISESKSRSGNLFHIVNYIMIMSVLFLSSIDYFIFVFIIPRVIHDISAYLIYLNHDTNRFKHKDHYIYKGILKTPASIITTSILVGILVTQLIHSFSPVIIISILMVVDFFHYYMESIIWKGKSSNRNYVFIKTN